MEKVVAGDQTALMAVYDRYSHLVYNLCLHVLGNQQASEDISQEVFLRIWRQAKAFNPNRGTLAGWITVMARHLAIDSLRKTQRELRAAESLVPANEATRAALIEDVRGVRLILEELPAEQREVLDLAYFGGLSHSEIALSTGLPLGTVKSRIRLALQNLRLRLRVDSKDPCRSKGE